MLTFVKNRPELTWQTLQYLLPVQLRLERVVVMHS